MKYSNTVVYDIQQQAVSAGKVELKEPNSGRRALAYDACCFAGVDDELVISASNDDSLLIWSLPESQDQNMTVDRSLCVLIGHEETIRSVRSSPDKLTFISCDDAGIIKLWTPNNFHA